jgi:hypothetical protein
MLKVVVLTVDACGRCSGAADGDGLVLELVGAGVQVGSHLTAHPVVIRVKVLAAVGLKAAAAAAAAGGVARRQSGRCVV